MFHLIFLFLLAGGKDIKVNTGQLIQGVVKSIDTTRKVVYLSSDPDLVSKCVVCYLLYLVYLSALLLVPCAIYLVL